jgi:Leucine-rich repeat (LRR) protein
MNNKCLDIRNKRNISLLDNLEQYADIHDLYADHNEFTSLPNSICSLINLRYVLLSGNQLTTLPDSICLLTNMEMLYIDRNQLTSLPDAIGDMTSLRELHAYKNKLTFLPYSIGSLTNLRVLSLYDNPLTTIPDSIGNLNNLHRLVTYGNKFSTAIEYIPAGKMRELCYIRTFYKNYFSLALNCSFPVVYSIIVQISEHKIVELFLATIQENK